MTYKGTIIYIGGFELPDKNAAAHRVLSNGKIFKDLGYKVVFIGIDKNLKSNINIIDTKNTTQGFDTWSMFYPKRMTDWIRYLLDIEDFKKIFNLYDDVCLVVAYNYQAIALNRLKKFCRSSNCKIIADCTEWYSTKGAGLLFKIIKGSDSFLRMRIIQKKLDGLIVISSYLEQYYKKHCKTIKIPPLVDLDEEKWKVSSDISRNINVKLIYSGSPGIEKDKINLLIDMLYEFRNNDKFSLEVVGLSKEQFIKDFPNYNCKLEELSEKIKFHGRVSHIQSLKILKSADACMFIRKSNLTTTAGFPTKFVESISCGIPVLTTETSDLNNYLEKGINGYFIDGISSDDTRNILNEVLFINPQKIKDLKINSLVDSKMFHYKNYNNIFKEFIEEIV